MRGPRILILLGYIFLQSPQHENNIRGTLILGQQDEKREKVLFCFVLVQSSFVQLVIWHSGARHDMSGV